MLMFLLVRLVPFVNEKRYHRVYRLAHKAKSTHRVVIIQGLYRLAHKAMSTPRVVIIQRVVQASSHKDMSTRRVVLSQRVVLLPVTALKFQSQLA